MTNQPPKKDHPLVGPILPQFKLPVGLHVTNVHYQKLMYQPIDKNQKTCQHCGIPSHGGLPMLKTLLAAAVSLTAVTAANATLSIEIFDNGALIDDITGVTSGAASLTTNDANFANITVNAQGSPILPRADLSSVTLDATASATFTGTHDLTVDVIQSAVFGVGNTLSTFTINGLVNDPGPTTESSFANGLLLSTHTFPVGQLDGSIGPLSAATGAFSADQLQYAVAFTAPAQSFGGSAQLTTNVPEPSTWVMLLVGFLALALPLRKRLRLY